MGKKKKKRITWMELKQYIPLYVMLLPACIYFFINGIFYSFLDVFSRGH